MKKLIVLTIVALVAVFILTASVQAKSCRFSPATYGYNPRVGVVMPVPAHQVCMP